ncbi:MAG: P-II family nitrogen regulator [Vicinamibacterales bacterium]|jgi:nitrogen regulatory protein PII
MFEVKAVVRLDKQDDVIRALHEIPDLPGVTLSVVEGIGRRQSMEGEAPQPFGRVSMAKIEIVVGADRLARVMAAIELSARTGRPGDGKVFVFKVEQVMKIRTGETGIAAL